MKIFCPKCDKEHEEWTLYEIKGVPAYFRYICKICGWNSKMFH